MEEMNNSSHGKKNKLHRLGLTVGLGDGIGGIVLLGGGLAVAGLIAAFSIIRRSNRKKYDDSATPSNKKHASTTLHQNQNSCITSCETSKIAVTVSQIDSPVTLSTHSLALVMSLNQGDQAVPIMDGEKENPSTFPSEKLSNFGSRESSLPVPDGPYLEKPEKMIKNESGEDMHLKKTVEVKKEDDKVETEILAVEENLPIRLGEGGDEEEDDAGESSAEDATEVEEEEEGWEEESSLKEHSPIQSDEEEEKEVGIGDRENECLVMKEAESSEGGWSVEDEEKKENEFGGMRKSAAEQNSPTLSVEEEEGDDSSKERNIEEEKSLEGIFSVEENAAMESAEKERGGNNDEDTAEQDVEEKDGESSEGTVGSSNESNVEAIWPAEMIEALSQELREMKALNKNLGEKTANQTEKYDFLDCKRKRNIKNDDKSSSKETTESATNVFHQKPAQAVVMINYLTVKDLNRRIWVWSILVLLLLLFSYSPYICPGRSCLS